MVSARLVILTNIPSPYRVSFFGALNEVLRQRSAELGVLFCARIEPNRQWDVRLEDQSFRWKILPGIHPNLKSIYPHINPTVVRELQTLQPTWLLIAGAWNTPTMLLAHLRWFAPSAPRIQWSEGHADAVLHPSGPIAKVRRRVLRAYNGFAVPNSRSADFIRSEVGSEPPILHLPNTVDDALFDTAPDASRAVVRAFHGLPVDQLVVTSVAQLEDRKGIRELVQGYHALSADELRRLTLVLIGEGSLKQELQQQIEAQHSGTVRLLGHMSQVQIRDILAASDAFILPAKRDPNPLSVIEAAFVGLPLIVTKYVGNAYELVTPGDNGYILESANPCQITMTLRLLLQCDATTLQTMGQVSRTVARCSFRRKTVASDFVDQLMAVFPPKA